MVGDDRPDRHPDPLRLCEKTLHREWPLGAPCDWLRQ